jgi:hypothetical protein
MLMIKEMSQKIHAAPNRHFIWLDVALLLLLTIYILMGIRLAPFHGDEATFLVMSEDYDRIVKQGDFSRVLFQQEESLKQNTRLSTGSILTYAIGLARDITDVEGPLERWLWGASWEQNVAQGNLPDPRLLRVARTFPAMMGALSIALFFVTARRLLVSRLAAWLATLTLATHGDVLVNFRRAIQEGPKFFFLILTLYIASHLLRNFQETNRRRYLYVCLGIASGLTLAAKQDAALLLVGIYLAIACLPLLWKERLQTSLTNLLYLGAATILALACFLLLMPVFWGWWESALVLAGFATILFQVPSWNIDRAAKPLTLAGCLLIIGMTVASSGLWGKFMTPLASLIETRGVIVESQIAFLKRNHQPYLETASDRLQFLLQTTLTSKVMYMEAASFDVPPFHEQIAAYEGSLMAGRTGSPWVDGFISVLAVMGGWSLLRNYRAESLLIYSMLITAGILLLITVPLPWQRYYLIMQIPYALMAGAGASLIGILGKNSLKSRTIR